VAAIQLIATIGLNAKEQKYETKTGVTLKVKQKQLKNCFNSTSAVLSASENAEHQ
jgi:hypothetical protein